MIERHFVDAGGNYLGGFHGFAAADGAGKLPADLLAMLPPGAVVVPGPPPVSGAQKWSGAAWSAAPAPVVEASPVEKLADVLIAKGLISTADAAPVKGARK